MPYMIVKETFFVQNATSRTQKDSFLFVFRLGTIEHTLRIKVIGALLFKWIESFKLFLNDAMYFTVGLCTIQTLLSRYLVGSNFLKNFLN